MLSRRELLIKSASMAATLSAGTLATALPTTHRLKSIGIRPFEIRPDNAAKTIHALEAIGYREMEMPYKDVEANWPVVQTSTLKKISVYIDGTLTAPGKEDELKQTFEQVTKWGFAYASCSYRPPDEGTGVDKYRIFAERMNRAAPMCHAAGLGPFLYHNQVFEFKPSNGTTGYQLVTETLDKKLCALEMDLYWVSLSGNDPVSFLHKYAGRVKITHLKDKPAGLPPMYEHAPGPGDFLDVGQGSMNWPAILRAGEETGVEHYIVEPDATSASDLVVHARRSYEYLSMVEF